MQSLTIVRTYFRLGLLNFVQYRADFFVAVFNAIIAVATQVLAIMVIFNQTDSLKGWSRDDLIVLAGVQLLVSGVLGIVIRPSLQAFMESIRLGTFDFLLTKPAEALLGRIRWENVLLTFALAVLFLAAARVFWEFAIRNYTGASA